MFLRKLFTRKALLVLSSALLMVTLFGYRAQAVSYRPGKTVGAAAPEAPSVLTHTTIADFDQTCATLTDTHVSEGLGGSVELAGAFADTFAGTTLDNGRWISGSWIGSPYTPVVSEGKLILPQGGYVRSNTAVFTHGVMEGKIEFTPGAWQHVGFAVPDLEFNPKFLLFSTSNTHGITATLYARVGLFSAMHDEMIGPLPAETHRYRIEWNALNAKDDLADYYLDGNLVYSALPFSNTILSNLNLWITNNGTQNQSLSVDEIQVAPPYATSGSYVSCPLDAAVGNVWNTASWVNVLPAGTGMVVDTRTSPDRLSWTGWNTVPVSGGNIALPDRYVQYRLSLTTNNANITPALDSISLTPIVASADLSLTKNASILNPDMGQSVSFTVTVNNAGPHNATGVEVKDVLQSGFTFSNTTASQGSYNNLTGIWAVGSIPSAGSASLTIQAVVNTTGNYSNAAEVWKSDASDPDSSPGNGPNLEDDYSTLALAPVPVADLKVTKTDTIDPVIAGTDVTYLITVQNLGPSNASNVVMTDTLPSGVTYKSVIPGGWTCTPLTGKVRCTLGSLGVASSNVTVVATVKPDTRVSVSNQAEVKSNIADRNTANNTVQESTKIDTLADLELGKVAWSATPYMGDTQVFTVTVTNKGPSQANGVKVKDLLATGYQFVGATASQGSYTQGNGEWTVGSLEVNQSAKLRLTAMVKASGLYDNYAQVSESNEPDPDSTPNDNSTSQDDDATVVVTPIPLADLSLVKLVSNSAPYVGDTVVFTVTVSNAGPSQATGVTVKDLLPSGYSFVGSSQPGSYDNVTGMWNIGALAAGQSLTLRITAAVKATGTYANRAEVWTSLVADRDSTPGAGVNEDDDDTVTVNPVASADLSITKQVEINPFPLYVEDTLLFKVTVTNNGPSDALGVVVKDLLPNGYTYVSAFASHGTYDAQTGLWTIGSLPLNQSDLLTVTAQVNISGNYKNIAEVWLSSVHDPDSTPGNGTEGEDDYGSVTLNPLPKADLSISKTMVTSLPVTGMDLEFQIKVTNSGPSPAEGVTINDVLPANHVFISSDHAVVNDNGVLTWDLGSIPANQDVVISLTIRGTQSGSYTNQVQVMTSSVYDPDSQPGNNVTTEDDWAKVDYNLKYYINMPLIQKNP